MLKKKKPWLAATLNILISGLGYIYTGKRKIFGSLLILMEIDQYIWIFMNPSILNLAKSFWSISVNLLFILAVSIDGYNTAKEVNIEIDKMNKQS